MKALRHEGVNEASRQQVNSLVHFIPGPHFVPPCLRAFHSFPSRSKNITCCHGRSSYCSTSLKPLAGISLLIWALLILCSSLIGTLGSSARNSTRTRRPVLLRLLRRA